MRTPLISESISQTDVEPSKHPAKADRNRAHSKRNSSHSSHCNSFDLHPCYPLPCNDILSGQSSASPSNQKTFATHYTAAKHARMHTAQPHDAHICTSPAYPPNAVYINIHRRTLARIASNARHGLATAQQTAHASTTEYTKADHGRRKEGPHSSHCFSISLHPCAYASTPATTHPEAQHYP